MIEKKRIALLIGSEQLSETLRLNLEDEGYNVIQLGGLKEDLRCILDGQIDMLIFDSDTYFRGTRFIREAKKLDASVPIVLLTSLEENSSELLLHGIEIAKILVKPFELDDFSNCIKNILLGGETPLTG